MVFHGSPLLVEVQRLYEIQGRDIDFSAVLSSTDARDDAALAELIEVDGRTRITRGDPVQLERYLAAVPDLRKRPDALDAALDVTLRSLSDGQPSNEDAVRKLSAQFPELKLAIREAAALNAAIWSTTGLRASVAPAPVKAIPCEFGPLMPEGTPRYQLQKLLGQGAFGQVYLALDRQLSEEGHTAWVAIKILVGRDRSPWARQRMIEEATKARRINHSNVVLVMDRGISADDEDFIVYEYVDGGDLSDLLHKQETMGIRQAVAMVAKIARGVHAAHSAGVIHCDLKPGNIMLTGGGEPKVADFGIAVRLNEAGAHAQQAQNQSGSGGPIGNLAFVSPEQYRGEEHALSVQSDVYALGGLLYLLLTKRLPNGATLEEIARTHDAKHGRQFAPAIRPIEPHVSRDLELICRRAMAPKPHERHNSAAALAEDLDIWLRGEPIAWTRPSMLHVATLWAKRKPALAISISTIGVLAIVSSIVLFNWRLSELDKAQKQQNRMLAANMMSVLKSPDYRFNTELFPIIWALEYFFGPNMIGLPDAQAELWKGRIEAIRRLVDSAEKQGRGRQMEPLLWKSTLAFWLVCDRNYQEADEILEENYADWEKKLEPEDPWLHVLTTLRNCAMVDRCIHASKTSRFTHDELGKLESNLVEDESRIASLYKGSQIHLLVLDRLADLYEPSLLDQPDRRQQFLSNRETLLEEKPYKSERKAAKAASQNK
jgi:serine/threonine protein kinase